MPEGAHILRMPISSAMRIRHTALRCPAFAVIAELLPLKDDPRYADYERVLAKTLRCVFQDIDMTRVEAGVIGSISQVRDKVIADEFAHMGVNTDAPVLLELYRREVWADETDRDVVAFAMYCVALLNRMYRLEAQVRRERGPAHQGGHASPRDF